MKNQPITTLSDAEWFRKLVMRCVEEDRLKRPGASTPLPAISIARLSPFDAMFGPLRGLISDCIMEDRMRHADALEADGHVEDADAINQSIPDEWFEDPYQFVDRRIA